MASDPSAGACCENILLNITNTLDRSWETVVFFPWLVKTNYVRGTHCPERPCVRARTSAPHACIRARPGALWTGARGTRRARRTLHGPLFRARARTRERSWRMRGSPPPFSRRDGVNSRRAGDRFGGGLWKTPPRECGGIRTLTKRAGCQSGGKPASRRSKTAADPYFIAAVFALAGSIAL